MAIQTIDVVFNGVGSEDIDLFSPDTYAEFDGAGGWIESDVQIDQVSAEFDGAGDWSLDLFSPDSYAEFDGVGDWSATPYQVDQIRATWQGAGTLRCDLYEFNINNVDYAAEDGTTLYVAEDGTTLYVTEWAADTHVFYVTENGIDNYVIEGALEDYTTEDGLTNYTDEGGTQPYYSLGSSGFLWDYVPENWQPATNFIFAEDWRGVGGFIANFGTRISASAVWHGAGGFTVNMDTKPQRQAANANWAGVGSFTASLVSADEIAAAWHGVGGWTIDVVSLKTPIFMNWNGVGGWSIDVKPLPFINQATAEFDGVGGWVESDVQYGVINTEFDGVGGFVVDMVETPATVAPIFMAWHGAGSWIVNVLEAGERGPRITMEFDGVGGWFADPFATSIGAPISAEFDGVGSLSIDLVRIAAPAAFPANFCLLDPVWRRLYNDTMEVGQPTTLLFNVGIPIRNPILTITRPDGSSYQAVENSVLVGKQTFPSEIYFGPTPYPSFQANQYVVYGFGLNELNQPGTWSVTLQSSAVTVTMPFRVNLLGASLLAA